MEARAGPSKKARATETEEEEMETEKEKKKEEVAAQAVQELRGLTEAVGRLTVAVTFGLGNLTREVSWLRQMLEEDRMVGWGERVDQAVGTEGREGEGAEDPELSQTLQGASEGNGVEWAPLCNKNVYKKFLGLIKFLWVGIDSEWTEWTLERIERTRLVWVHHMEVCNEIWSIG
jgi:hypothetical protein